MNSKDGKRSPAVFVAAALVFWVVMALSFQIKPASLDPEHCLKYPLNFINYEVLLVSIYSAVVFFLVLILTDRKIRLSAQKPPEKACACSPARAFLNCFFLSMAVRGAVFLVFFPGAGMNDSINMLMSQGSMAGMQPLPYILAVHWIYRILRLVTGRPTVAFGVMILMQIFCFSLMEGYLGAWMAKKGLGIRELRFCMLLSILMPISADYGITLVRESWLGFLMLLLLPSLYDLLADREKADALLSFRGRPSYRIILPGSALLASALTPVGFPVLLLFSVPMLITQKKLRRAITAFLAAALLLHEALWAGGSLFQQDRVEFRELSGLATAEIAAQKKLKLPFTEEENALLRSVLNDKNWRAGYRFSDVNAIRYNSRFNVRALNADRGGYLRAAAESAARNPVPALKAVMYHTYGSWSLAFWNTGAYDASQSVFERINNNTDDGSTWGVWLRENGIGNRPLLPEPLQGFLVKCLHGLFRANLIFCAGGLVCFYLCCILFLRRYGKKIGCWFAPLLLYWIMTALTAGASMVYRNAFPLLTALPVVICVMKTAFRRGTE